MEHFINHLVFRDKSPNMIFSINYLMKNLANVNNLKQLGFAMRNAWKTTSKACFNRFNVLLQTNKKTRLFGKKHGIFLVKKPYS